MSLGSINGLSKVQAASSSSGGVVTTTEQTFAGKKIFSGGIEANDLYSRGVAASGAWFKTTNRTTDGSYGVMGGVLVNAVGKAYLQFSEKSKSSSTGKALSYSEFYNLPSADDDLSASATYNILTSKGNTWGDLKGS